MNKTNINAIKKEICQTSYKLWQKNYVAANDGNISVRLGGGRFLITASGISKMSITPETILEINAQGEVLDGNTKYKPSSEIDMHIKCYMDRQDINAVVHAHPPFATSFAAANIALDKIILPEIILTLGGGVPISNYAKPGTQEMADSIAPFLTKYNAILLQNHGVLTLGKDLEQGYMRMETVEHLAKITFISAQIGGAKELSKQQIEDLKAKT